MPTTRPEWIAHSLTTESYGRKRAVIRRSEETAGVWTVAVGQAWDYIKSRFISLVQLFRLSVKWREGALR